MMKKVDLFKADKTMSARVEEYVKCRVLRKAIQKDYDDKIQSIDIAIKSIDNLKGSTLEKKDSDAQKLALFEAREKLVAEKKAQIAKEATFELTKGDKEFKKALKGLSLDSPAIAEAIIEWFSNYGLEVTDSILLADVIAAIGGKEDFHKLVDTEGIDGITVDATRALSMLYWVAFRHMATVGTIKSAQIPEIIRNNFGEKAKAEKKAQKKAAKQAQKNNK